LMACWISLDLDMVAAGVEALVPGVPEAWVTRIVVLLWFCCSASGPARFCVRTGDTGAGAHRIALRRGSESWTRQDQKVGGCTIDPAAKEEFFERPPPGAGYHHANSAPASQDQTSVLDQITNFVVPRISKPLAEPQSGSQIGNHHELDHQAARPMPLNGASRAYPERVSRLA